MNHSLQHDSTLARTEQLRAEAAQARLARQCRRPGLLALVFAQLRREPARPVRTQTPGRALSR